MVLSSESHGHHEMSLLLVDWADLRLLVEMVEILLVLVSQGQQVLLVWSVELVEKPVLEDLLEPTLQL